MRLFALQTFSLRTPSYRDNTGDCWCSVAGEPALIRESPKDHPEFGRFPLHPKIPAAASFTPVTRYCGSCCPPQEKLKAAQLHSTEVNRQSVQAWAPVPGKIDYRSTRRVDIKAPVDSVVQQVLVKPRIRVNSGSRLALLDSPEIGFTPPR